MVDVVECMPNVLQFVSNYMTVFSVAMHLMHLSCWAFGDTALFDPLAMPHPGVPCPLRPDLAHWPQAQCLSPAASRWRSFRFFRGSF